ncbi:AAA family ATPase [Rhodococcoides kyotonense]|uniref:Nuclease SbcCD subunit C n=1 Tax=Rhodococcoides kyotonense TaxID=398843 RepID=A0A239I9L2_9NOCA|nr:SMC family ATPase [Rhodococcus kyotonensis]SNS90275.1 exonuclease SbcC [Rhodococcus kyotonensis]
MRLHRLEITAFGPFGGTECVDFDALGADGLFLLHGRTGAGKTTVLDAVAFALYGTVPGARREGKRLLSDHAETGVAPSVTLEATLGGRRVRIVRSPEYFRPKKRGTGTTKENAKASLTWLDGTGQNLTRLDEIGDAVGLALGMSADQFFQVVLLPQGEFARFLRADSDERGNLLERLFDTARFGDVEQWFAERRRLSAAELESSSRAIDKLMGKIATAAGEPEQLDRPPVEWATELLEAGRSAHRSATAALVSARAVSESAVAELGRLESTATAQQRRDVAQQQLSDFQSSATERETLRREIDRSVAAGPVAAMAQECAAAKAALSAAMRSAFDAGRSLAAVPGSDSVLAELDSTSEVDERAVVADAVRVWTTEVGVLDELRAVERRAADEQRTARALAQQHESIEQQIATLLRTRDGLPAAIESAEQSVDAAVRAAAAIETLTDTSTRVAEAVRAAIELTKKRAARVKADRALDAARTAHNTAREHLLDLRERRLTGMAAELAAALVTGEPCGVCGSTVHPAPAKVADTTVTKADEDAAAKDERATAATVETRAAEVAALLRAIDALVQTSGDRDSAGLAAELDAATQALTVARADADALDARRRRLDDLRAEDLRIATVVAEQRSEAAALVARREQVLRSVEQMVARLARAIDGEESIDQRTHRLDQLIRRSTALLDARVASADAATVVQTVTDRLDQYVTESGFASAEEAARAVVPARRATEIEKHLAAANDVRAHAEQVLAEPAIAAVVGTDAVDTEPARAAVARAAEELDAAVATHAECKRRTEQVEELTAQLWAAVDRAAPMQAKHDELAALADVVAGRGQNARKMSLRSYVLASRLEDVAESASIRLHRMSGGRYEFVHSDEAESRGRRGGLGLDIRDDYTGVVRSAKTLSGGESFLASLALALGLADVVAAESGGVVLDTMFIDEGFGTLDAETLESVMGVLDELRAGGRVVGIVSHVDEMRQRIPSRLHVVRERDGSRIRLHAAS